MKTFAFKVDPLTGEQYYEVYLRGQQLLTDPLLNKGSHFSIEERASLGLTGLLPHGVSSLEEEVARSLESYRRKPDDLERYIFLLGLLNRNETLYYKLLTENLIEMLPIVYTPTVGQACLLLSRIMRRARGVYVHPDNIAAIDAIFANVPLPEVQLIVVTDGERILGLGDLGADGMGIPVGKVSLYVAAGGLHPACCLPVCLDVGTNNERLLADPLYLGFRRRRLEGEDYDRFVERFVLGVKRNFPNALIQWEDFAKHTAFRLLERYRERVPSFNDDIQGTGATALAALLTASRIKKQPLRRERVLIVGFGQAGVGTAQAIFAYLRRQGLTAEEARSVIWAVDVQGLLLEDDPSLEPWQQPFARRREEVAGWRLRDANRIGLEDVVANVKPTVLVGVTAQSGLFSQKLLQQVAKEEPRPVILALSNPTSKSECTPEEALQATQGRALVATGSPFPPVPWEGQIFETSQCNNLYMFPGVGLGTLVARAPKVTDEMFLAASQALSNLVTADEMARGMLLPPLSAVRKVAWHVALAVARQARDQGLGRLLEDSELEQLVTRAQWEPKFVPYRPGRL
ncbi:MAG: NAD-dependent malic enzyme [Thermoanaerobaculum sp.]|nr:NAD-dependent malic enzyme [Thermoanaerobaculum sp.]MDW7967230.1 NAD-dependent malic enzyme [Thermoanaerobaculum sp.]